MRIAFFCGSIEPGQDGVGDYTRRLAATCVKLGSEAVIVGLSDQGVSRTLEQEQGYEGTSVMCCRLPASASWPRRLVTMRGFVNQFQPDWVSLQFVPYAFHPKGLPVSLSRRLATLRGDFRRHIMFHELWIGAAQGQSWKHRMIGVMQRWVIRSLLRTLRPTLVCTHASPYVEMLRQLGWSAERLPLFGNIPISKGGASSGWELIRIRSHLNGNGKGRSRAEWLVGGIFGTIHPQWSPEPLLSQLFHCAQGSGRRAMLVVLGRHGCNSAEMDMLFGPYREMVTVVELGELSTLAISSALQALDFGIAASPFALIEKSGSVAAMLEHGLPVVVTRDDWHLNSDACVPTTKEPLLARLADLSQDQLLAFVAQRREPASRLPSVAECFLNALTQSSRSPGI